MQRTILKNQIKELVAQQKFVKPQRKTLHFMGERTLNPLQALYTHLSNRSKLRELNLIYGLSKGRIIDEVDKNAVIAFSVDRIKKIWEQALAIKQEWEDYHASKALDNNS